MNFDDKLEKDIKILINYIIFHKELLDTIAISKTSKYFKCYSNCYLNNVTLWHKYYCYQFEKIIITLLDDESKKFKPLNNKPITGNIIKFMIHSKNIFQYIKNILKKAK